MRNKNYVFVLLAHTATSLDEIDVIAWDYKTASNTGVIDRLIAENTLIN